MVVVALHFKPLLYKYREKYRFGQIYIRLKRNKAVSVGFCEDSFVNLPKLWPFGNCCVVFGL
jgi:hypothetical protein